MPNFSILFFIFATCVLLVGLYMFTGHKLGILEGMVRFRGLTIDDWKNIGKWTMVSSLVIYAFAIIGWIFNFE